MTSNKTNKVQIFTNIGEPKNPTSVSIPLDRIVFKITKITRIITNTGAKKNNKK